ncbi:MAG: hypothetical protein ABF876_05935 [Acetobacter aceti]|uniref:Uncharacterized protein n=1 Tax=Acetobacter aceti TaxID=435 RepID=A0A1U9KFE2_ACEAC|nr:hypothetical protein [Acetobacter aceti]AQS84520.1 hypothetical protein A0U92_06700 [Acetobacter aceti]
MSGVFKGNTTPNPKAILEGMTLLASGRAEGLQRFGNSIEHFLAALAPGLAMCLVGLLTVPLQKDPALGFIRVELSFCTLLALPVISHFFAKKWGREELWLRYATAGSWCEWITVLVSAIAMSLGTMLFSSVAGTPGFAMAIVMSSDVYGIWLGIFVAKIGLRLSWPRAALLYGTTFCFALICYGLASLLPPHYNFINDLLQPVITAQTASSSAT